MSKYMDLCRKLYELSKRGEGGEKESAKRMLDSAMARHGISISDIEGEEIKQYRFKIKGGVKGDLIDLFFCVVYSCFDSEREWPRIYTVGNERTYAYVDLTAKNAAEVSSKFRFYANLFESESKLFRVAFIQKNGLGIKRDTPSENSKWSDDEIWRISQMMEGIDRKSFLKQLS